MKPIIDKFTNLPVSRQRKWQLRHPIQAASIQKKYMKKLRKKPFTLHFTTNAEMRRAYYAIHRLEILAQKKAYRKAEAKRKL